MHEILDIVNERDEVIGTAERTRAHAEGLKIRLVYVWFYTPEGRIIMQRRSAQKKSSPNRLICTVSGHVESGSSYLEAAIKETREETGISVGEQDLRLASNVFEETGDAAQYITAAFRACYTYCYRGSIDDLRIEPGEGAGFEVWEPSALLQALDDEPDNFGSFMLHDTSRGIIRNVQRKITT